MPTRVLIAENWSLVRHGLTLVLGKDPEIELVGEASGGFEAAEKAVELTPDVIVLNCSLPDLDGVSVTRNIREHAPGVNILAFSTGAGAADDDTLFRIVQAGARGYFTMDTEQAEIAESVKRVGAGQVAFSSAMTSRLFEFLGKAGSPAGGSANGRGQDLLTEREKHVLRLLCQGMPNKQIAHELVVSQNTVRAHVRALMQKLEMENRTQLAIYGMRHGYSMPDQHAPQTVDRQSGRSGHAGDRQTGRATPAQTAGSTRLAVQELPPGGLRAARLHLETVGLPGPPVRHTPVADDRSILDLCGPH